MLGTTSLRRLGGLLLLVILALLHFSPIYPLIKPFPSSSQNLGFGFSTPSNQSFPPLYQTYRKRDQDFLNKFGCLVNKGIKYFEEGVVYATEGFGDPPPNYGPNPIRDNGWTVSEAEDPLPAIWDEVFADIPPREPEPDEYTFVKLTQDQKFKNAWHEDNPATGATYNGFYIPFSNAILMTWTYSPRFHIRRRGIPEKDIEQYIPRLNTVSDVVWETWKANAPKPATLRFYAVDGVINDVAAPLIDYLLERDAEPDEMGWEGRLTYGLDSDEGKALFGTPSGLAVAWLLIRNHGILGRRDLRVSIFRDEEEEEDKEKRCMIWELIPEGGKSKFDEYESRIGPIRR